MSLKKVLNFTVVVGLITALNAYAGVVSELGVLDLSANGGINPATGSPWQPGDTYRLAFTTSQKTMTMSTDINYYNSFVQNVADISQLGLSGAAWKVIGSTKNVTAKANTSTDSGTGEAIFLLDGVTKIADNYADLWDGSIDSALNMDENGSILGEIEIWTGTGTSGSQEPDRYFGTTVPSKNTSVVVGTGRCTETGGRWLRVFNAGPSSLKPVYALSDPLTVRYVNFNLPSVDAGDDWISWSGQAFTLDPNVVNNDQQTPQRQLTYAWSADPSEGIVFTPDANTQAPSVTVTKADHTGGATEINLTLEVTLVGEGSRSDTMTVYLYDDACQAGKAGTCILTGPTDLDGSCFTDLNDFSILAQAWLTDYDIPDLAEFSGMWLDGDVLDSPVSISVVVDDVVGESESSAQSILATSGLGTYSTYDYDDFVPVNHVISTDPNAGSKIPACGNVNLVLSRGPAPLTEPEIAEVYLAQTHVQKPDDQYFKLVGNRNTLLKVQVIAPDGTAAPPVTAVVTVEDQSTELTLNGPETLVDSYQSQLGQVEHKHDDSFTVLIPAEWIKPGLHISVTAGNSTVEHDIKVGAPTAVRMHMYDVHYFGLGNSDYPAGTLEELESKWPVSSLNIERIRNINFPELVIPARAGAPHVRVSSKQDYKDQTGLNFDGEQAAALKWVGALSASGGNRDVAMQYINIIGVSAGGQAGGFNGVGGISYGILNHELGHALSLPHWGNNAAYPYKGEMYGIEPQPGVYMGTHVGPTWGFDLRTLTFIPPTVQPNTVGSLDLVGYYKKSPMQGGGTGDQEQGFLLRYFSDYGVNKMRNYLEGKVAVQIDGNYYKWNDAEGDYTIPLTNNGVQFPIQQDVQVYSVMAAACLADPNVNMVYTPIGPYTGNLIRTFDPTNPNDRADANLIYAPSTGCDFTLRVVQGAVTKYYMLQASANKADDPYSSGSLKTAAVNLPASNGTITRVELLLTPDVEDNGLPANPQVLYTWSDNVTGS